MLYEKTFIHSFIHSEKLRYTKPQTCPKFWRQNRESSAEELKPFPLQREGDQSTEHKETRKRKREHKLQGSGFQGRLTG